MGFFWLQATFLFPVGEVENALSLEDDFFEQQYGVAKPSQDTEVIFSCRAGVRSLVALETANKLGYSRCVNIYCSVVYSDFACDFSLPQSKALYKRLPRLARLH